MNRFIIMLSFILLNASLAQALYIPGNRDQFTYKQVKIMCPAGLERKMQNKTYTRLVFRFSKNPDKGDLDRLGIIPMSGSDNIFTALVPETSLSLLEGAFPFLATVQRTYPAAPGSFIGEETFLMDTVSFVSNGFAGEGVKIAVIDLGFYGFSDSVAAGELPADVHTVNYSYSSIDAYDDGDGLHGTAVAEIIHEIAPQAELHLIKIDGWTSLLNAKEYCIENGIRIVNHSVGWVLDGWGEGDGDIYRLIVEPLFSEHGALWCNSAGNNARRHYQAVYNDTGGRHDFGGGRDYGVISNVSANEWIDLFLKWDGYSDNSTGTTFADYDLFLYSSPADVIADNPTASSEEEQNPYYAWEYISYQAPSSKDYYYTIKKRSTPGNIDHSLQVYTYGQDISPVTPARSLMPPSDGHYSFTVGAVAWSNWNKGSPSIEYFSSQGPAQDGTIKPDVSAIDGMTNYTYGRFYGTSAASPVAAGLAALILSKQPYLSSDQLFYLLKDNARDAGAPGEDPVFGAGLVRLVLLPSMRNAQTLSSNVIVAPTRLHGDKRLYYYGVTDLTMILLRTQSGTVVKEFYPVSGQFFSGENSIDLAPLSLSAGIYIVEFIDGSGNHYVRKIINYH